MSYSDKQESYVKVSANWVKINGADQIAAIYKERQNRYDKLIKVLVRPASKKFFGLIKIKERTREQAIAEVDTWIMKDYYENNIGAICGLAAEWHWLYWKEGGSTAIKKIEALMSAADTSIDESLLLTIEDFKLLKEEWA